MTTFILILSLYYYKAAGLAMQEFDSRAACEHAITEIRKVREKNIAMAICVPKQVDVGSELKRVKEENEVIVKKMMKALEEIQK